jgi:hypothetical protein
MTSERRAKTADLTEVRSIKHEELIRNEERKKDKDHPESARRERGKVSELRASETEAILPTKPWVPTSYKRGCEREI